MDNVDFGLLVLRIAMGFTIMAHGWNHLFGGGRLPGTALWFESMGMKPGWLQARLATATEFGAGVLIVLGLFTPLGAAGVIGLMIVAIVVAHRRNGFFVFRPGQGWEYCAFLAAAAFTLGAIGAGSVSLDNAFGIGVDNWWGAVVAGIIGPLGAFLLLAVSYRPPARAAKG